MDDNVLKNKKNILVVGYGISGKSVTSFLISKGHNVYVYDDNNDVNVVNRITVIDWDEIDFIIKSPSIHIMPHNRHPVIDEAIINTKPVYSTFDVFKMYNPNAKVIGITGTNGKSTTVSLIYHILKSAGISVALGGNIGIPYFDTLKYVNPEYYVFEMSSYELTSSQLLNFEIGGLINIEPDHLDFHGSFENYIDAKHKILDYSKYKIISIDDKYTFNKYKDKPRTISISLSQDAIADYHIENNLLITNNDTVLDISNLPNLVGTHNAQNIMFAYAVCSQLGISHEKIVHGITTFEPLPHRMNTVRKIGDVLFINDSKATNPTSSAPALATFAGYKIYWLVGGRSKHVDPMLYVGKYIDSVERIYLFGEATEEFRDIFGGMKPIENCKTMDVAVRRAYRDAKNELGATVVLLSPMCSSFDQFKNFEHRGNVFVKLVNEL